MNEIERLQKITHHGSAYTESYIRGIEKKIERIQKACKHDFIKVKLRTQFGNKKNRYMECTCDECKSVVRYWELQEADTDNFNKYHSRFLEEQAVQDEKRKSTTENLGGDDELICYTRAIISPSLSSFRTTIGGTTGGTGVSEGTYQRSNSAPYYHYSTTSLPVVNYIPTEVPPEMEMTDLNDTLF